MSTADLTRINQASPPHGHVQHTASIAFGPRLQVERYDLANGLRVLLLRDPAAPLFAYHTWYRVGSRDEREGKTGIAHLFEHLMFNETEKLPKGEFDRCLERVGAENNASTWLDFTQYNISAPKEQLELVIGLEAERMRHLVLRSPQVESEKEVVANERRYRVDDDVEGAVNELLWSTAFRAHPYKWPTVGWMQDILGFTTDDCEEFYQTYYAPNNATVIVVGDFDPNQALTSISKHYGEIPSATLPARSYPVEPPQTEERRVEVKKQTLTEKLSLGYHSVGLADPDHVAVSVLCDVLAGGRASRLYRALVRQQQVAAEVRAYVGPFADPGLLEVYASAREAHTADELLTAIDAELSRLRSEAISQLELDRARARVELSLLHGLENAEGKAHTLGFYDCVIGRPNAAFERMALMGELTPERLLAVAQRAFDPRLRSVVLVRPGAEGLEASDDAPSEEAEA